MTEIVHNVADRRHGLVGSWRIEPLDITKLTEADIGRTVIYRDHEHADAGTLTSWRGDTVFARYSRGDISAGACASDLVFGITRADSHPDTPVVSSDVAFEQRDHITRTMLRAEPDTLFVFGDNMVERGRGGQAKEMRGEPNAVGIPTKHLPEMSERAFFRDEDLPIVYKKIDDAYMRLLFHIGKGGKVVWPSAGIGTGLAQLEKRAPAIWQLIENIRKTLMTTPMILSALKRK